VRGRLQARVLALRNLFAKGKRWSRASDKQARPALEKCDFLLCQAVAWAGARGQDQGAVGPGMGDHGGKFAAAMHRGRGIGWGVLQAVAQDKPGRQAALQAFARRASIQARVKRGQGLACAHIVPSSTEESGDAGAWAANKDPQRVMSAGPNWRSIAGLIGTCTLRLRSEPRPPTTPRTHRASDTMGIARAHWRGPNQSPAVALAGVDGKGDLGGRGFAHGVPVSLDARLVRRLGFLRSPAFWRWPLAVGDFDVKLWSQMAA
jgi:hypothetical protein